MFTPKLHCTQYTRYLNWYTELYQDFDVLKNPASVYKLVGLADYDEALTVSASDTLYAVVLKIDTYESDSLCEYDYDVLFILSWSQMLFILLFLVSIHSFDLQ